MSAIEIPTMLEPRRINDAWTVLPSWLPVPGLGALPVNSFLLKCVEPMLVDTGLAMLGDAWTAALEGEVDPEDLRWIWLSHMDADHIGNLTRIMERAPNAKVVTNFLGVGKMGMMGLDASRVHLLNPGDTLTVGGRTLTPVRPPYYDAPETIGFVDAKDGVFFAADSFGALLPEIVHETGEADANALRDGLVGWSSIDAPWLAQMDRTALARHAQGHRTDRPGLGAFRPPAAGARRDQRAHPSHQRRLWPRHDGRRRPAVHRAGRRRVALTGNRNHELFRHCRRSSGAGVRRSAGSAGDRDDRFPAGIPAPARQGDHG